MHLPRRPRHQPQAGQSHGHDDDQVRRAEGRPGRTRRPPATGADMKRLLVLACVVLGACGSDGDKTAATTTTKPEPTKTTIAAAPTTTTAKAKATTTTGIEP